MPNKKNRMLLMIFLLNCVLINCTINDIFTGLGDYSRALETQESQKSTKTAYQATLTYLESFEDQAADPQQPPISSESAAQEMPSSAESVQGILPTTPQPIPGLAGKWDYISSTEAKEHLYTMAITWDGQAYKVTNCTYVYKDGSCEVQGQSWDGTTFSFSLFFPHTGTLTSHTITGVSGDTLTGTRSNEQFGTGSIVWSRSH